MSLCASSAAAAVVNSYSKINEYCGYGQIVKKRGQVKVSVSKGLESGEYGEAVKHVSEPIAGRKKRINYSYGKKNKNYRHSSNSGCQLVLCKRGNEYSYGNKGYAN